MELKLIESLVKESHKHLDQAEEYLATRSLLPFKGIGFAPAFDLEDNLATNAFTIEIRDPQGALVLVDAKDIHTGTYSKYIVGDLIRIPTYNVDSIVDYRVITEGVFNAESINQNISICPASATLRASINTRMFHWLAFSVRKGLIFSFDNDRAGVDNAKSAIKFIKEFYPELRVHVLDHPFNDLNEFLIKKGPSVFKRVINEQLIGFCK